MFVDVEVVLIKAPEDIAAVAGDVDVVSEG